MKIYALIFRIYLFGLLLMIFSAWHKPAELPEKIGNICISKCFFTNDPPVLTATGNQVYCPGSPMKVVTGMTITDPDDTATDAVYIQISSGYDNTQDLLSLNGSHPGITASWDAAAGKLTLKSPSNIPVSYTDFIAAIQDVFYNNNSTAPSGTRVFSISVGQANYLPSTDHYYQFIPSLGITWSSAKTLAAQSTYYGLQGYLATITATDEAQLSGKQASGAGWIGGSDADSEGIWKWVTGPENGTVFWNGGPSGSTPNFALWNNGEPNNLNNENYAHITAPGVGITGSWNDLSNTGDASGNYQPKGYIVEYGGMPGDPVLHISTSTTITISKITAVTAANSCGPASLTLTAAANSGTVKWYDVPAGGAVLATGTSYTTPMLTVTKTYYADASDTGCSTAARTAVTATINDIPLVSVIAPAPACEGSVILTASAASGTIQWFGEAISGTALASGNTFTTPVLAATRTYYVQANNNGCVSGARIPVTVTIYPKPAVSDETLPICENGTRELDAGIANAGYLWSPSGEITKIITISGPGTYSVAITSAAPESCTAVKTFTVIEKATPVIDSVNVEGTLVTIVANSGDFEFAIDNGDYQESNVFEVSEPGIHTAHVVETGMCGNDRKDFAIIIVPSFFTPNADSHNDYWTIGAMALYPQAKVSIFDRYGKLIAELDRNNLTWNGTYDGRPLPSSDYWYVIKMDGNAPEIRGHFSLLR